MAPHSRARRPAASALTGLAQVANLACEAADDVPVVKQILALVARIAGLAEKMDKNREALHALAERSVGFAHTVRAVAAGRPTGALAPSLAKLCRVFEAVEELMAVHVARGRVRRALSYAFTTAQHVERLTQELSDAVQEFMVVAHLDTNLSVGGLDATVRNQARFEGEFRLLRHCEVEKLDAFFEERSEDDTFVVRYHRARVDGRLFAVRYLEANATELALTATEASEASQTRVAEHDHILEELSTVQRSHRNVASIYGWNNAGGRDRFTVLKSGFYPLGSHGHPKGKDTQFALNVVSGLLDGARHLEALGVVWLPEDLFLDEHGQPTLGLSNDLGRRGSMDLGRTAYKQMEIINLVYMWLAPSTVTELSDARAEELSLVDPRLAVLRNSRADVFSATLSVPTAARPRLSPDTGAYLRAMGRFYEASRSPTIPPVDLTLHMLGYRAERAPAVWHFSYCAAVGRENGDIISLVTSSDDGDVLQSAINYIVVPEKLCREARAAFAVKMPAELADPPREFIVKHIVPVSVG